MAKIFNRLMITFWMCLLILQACTPPTRMFRSNYSNANTMIHSANNLTSTPFLKAHLKNGGIYILKDTWSIDSLSQNLNGEGTLYDFNRAFVFTGAVSVPIDSVAIFETNVKIKKPESLRVTGLTILAALDVVVALICITNPKACFGSCPTFYMNGDDHARWADAEGFTNAISPSLEYEDIDALNNQQQTHHLFSITMKNEALESHFLHDVKLLAYPRNAGQRIYQSRNNDFYRCENSYHLSNATANEGDITALLGKEDKQERFSLSDPKNLLCKEEVFLCFDDVRDTKDLGLLIDFRQTLMNTYLFYNAMGYMGDAVSDVFAKMETNKTIRDKFKGTNDLLGNIEVYSWNEPRGRWEHQGTIDETGPIAINKQIVPLQGTGTGSKVKLKLVMNKGLWRIDYTALTNIREKVKPFECFPYLILNKGREDSLALAQILDPARYLVSMPGSEYLFNFKLPGQSTDYELFLYTKGYYLEWMRAHWIGDKNLSRLKQMVIRPQKYLKSEAGNYKKYESDMEEIFWNSRVNTKTFTYHEK